jgi:hypothetical protein
MGLPHKGDRLDKLVRQIFAEPEQLARAQR